VAKNDTPVKSAAEKSKDRSSSISSEVQKTTASESPADIADIVAQLLSSSCRMYKHIRAGLLESSTAAKKPPHLRVFGVSEDGRVHWGEKEYERSVVATRVVTGADAVRTYKGMTRDQIRWSFKVEGSSRDDALYLIALSESMFRVWTEGLKFLIDRRDKDLNLQLAPPDVHSQLEYGQTRLSQDQVVSSEPQVEEAPAARGPPRRVPAGSR
jgi:hypothetical protein